MLRHLKPEDIPALHAIYDTNRAKEDASLPADCWLKDLPDLTDPKQTFAAVVERDGRVTGALVFHAVAEVISVAETPADFRELLQGGDAVRGILKDAGVGRVYVFVLDKHKRSQGRALKKAGFFPVENLTAFALEVR